MQKQPSMTHMILGQYVEEVAVLRIKLEKAELIIASLKAENEELKATEDPVDELQGAE